MPDHLTQQDVQDYGTELVNFSQRAAAYALGPQIENLQQQTAELRHRLAGEAHRNLDQRVAMLVG